MPNTTIRAGAVAIDSGSWTRTGGTSNTNALSDNSDATYLTAGSAGSIVAARCEHNVPSTHLPIAFRAFARSKRASGKANGELITESGSTAISATALTTYQSALMRMMTAYINSRFTAKHTTGGVVSDMGITVYSIVAPTVEQESNTSASSAYSPIINVSINNDTAIPLKIATNITADYYGGTWPEFNGLYQPRALYDVPAGFNGVISIMLPQVSLQQSEVRILPYQLQLSSDAGVFYTADKTYTVTAGAFTAPAAPTLYSQSASTVDGILGLYYKAEVSESLYSSSVVVIERQRADGSWEEIAQLPSGDYSYPLLSTPQAYVLAHNPFASQSYRAYTKAIDATLGTTVLSPYSSTLTKAASTNIKCSIVADASTILSDVFFTDFDSGQYASDYAEKWPIGASSPIIRQTAKRLPSGSFAARITDTTALAKARAIVQSNEPVYIVTPAGEKLKVMLKGDAKITRANTRDIVWIFTSSFQEVA